MFCKDTVVTNYVLGNEDHMLFAYAVIQMLTTHTSYFQFFSSGFIYMKHVTWRRASFRKSAARVGWKTVTLEDDHKMFSLKTGKF